MSAAILPIVRAYWPAYADVPDATVEMFIVDAAVEIGRARDRWGALYDRAIAALVAHQLEVRARSAAAAGAPGQGGTGSTATGALASLNTGAASVSYTDGAGRVASKAAAGMSDAVYASTAGGQEYLRLRSRVPSFLMVTV